MAKKTKRNMAKTKRKSFLISAGNSSTDPVGFCVRVKALTKEEALKKVKDALPECIDAGRDCDDTDDDIEYFNIYTNTEALNITDIDDGDTEDVDDEDEDEES